MNDRSIEEIRDFFPVLRQRGAQEPLIYLDSAATALTALPVIEAIESYYRSNSTNIHRGLYRLSEEATRRYEEAREKVARFIGAPSPEEVIFTHGTTEAVNLLAYSWAAGLGPEKTIVATEMEHHANLVPWQECARRTGAALHFMPADPRTGELGDGAAEYFRRHIPESTALVAVTGMSNVTGIRPPIADIVVRAREVGAKVLLDAAQLSAHEPLDVTEWDVDFLTFSGHKLYGPTGIGVLWARSGLLSEAPPFLSGGDMIERVSLEGSVYRRPPQRFEAGTPHIAGAIGLGAAVDFISSLGFPAIAEHDRRCTQRLLDLLREFDSVEIYGPGKPETASAVVSFNVVNVHPHDVGTLLAEHGIAVRAGYHCAQPYVEKLGARGTVRAAVGVYTSDEEIDALREALSEVTSIFG